MSSVFVDDGPGVGGRVFFPDQDASVVGAGGKEAAPKLGVGPGELPDRAFVADENAVGGEGGLTGLGVHVEDADGAVGRRSGHPQPIIIKFKVVLQIKKIN